MTRFSIHHKDQDDKIRTDIVEASNMDDAILKFYNAQDEHTEIEDVEFTMGEGND